MREVTSEDVVAAKKRHNRASRRYQTAKVAVKKARSGLTAALADLQMCRWIRSYNDSLLDQRPQECLALRRAGLTYKAIGEQIGGTLSRARYLVQCGEWNERHPIADRNRLPLSVRTINSLKNAGFLPQKKAWELEPKDVLTFLARITDAELYQIRNVRERAVCELRTFERFFKT